MLTMLNGQDINWGGSVDSTGAWTPVGTLVQIKHTVENRVDTATVEIVYDSLGYMKISKVFRLGFYQITGWSLRSTLLAGYDSTIYIKDGIIIKTPVIMEVGRAKQ